MKRHELEHILRASAAILGEKDLHRDEPKQSRGSSKPTVR